MANRVTIREVAKKAGVSVSTVSRVLSGSETQITISDETRLRINQVATELSYRPHLGAQLMRGKAINLLGLIVRQIDDPFFSQLIDNIRTESKQQGYDIVLGSAEGDPVEALILHDLLLDLRYCSGLFLLGDLQESWQDRSFLTQMSEAYPLVLLCRGSEQLVGDVPSVATDNRKGARMALDYLTGLGHEHIAFIGPLRQGDMNERYLMYCEYMQARFGTLYGEPSTLTENSHEGGYKEMMKLLSARERPTAVFAVDDSVALGAMKAAAMQGIRVPEDVSIMGFDDVKVSAYLTPALTTIRQPIEEISRRAIGIMRELTLNKGTAQRAPHALIEPTLIVRQSCSRPPR